MAELKHISEVEQVAEVKANDSLIGERDGRAVRIPSSKVVPEGMVKSVNGAVPDANGDVQLDVSFEIPSTIPNIQTAQVGQTVVVKAVDENGKPTEWETMNASSYNLFLVTLKAVWDGHNETYEPDRTFQEIVDALKAGMLPVAMISSYEPGDEDYLNQMFYLESGDSRYGITFRGLAGGSTVRCKPDNTWEGLD